MYWQNCLKHNIKIDNAGWKKKQYEDCPVCKLEKELQEECELNERSFAEWSTELTILQLQKKLLENQWHGEKKSLKNKKKR